MKQGKRKGFKIVLTLVVIGIIIGMYVLSSAKPVEYRTFTAIKSSIEKKVTGSGTLAASKSKKEYAKVSAEIKNIFFEEGDHVKVGDVLMTLDAKTYASSIDAQNIAIKQSQLSKDTIQNQIRDLTITANATGYVYGLSISEGSYVGTTSPICNIIKNGVYEVTLDFVYQEHVMPPRH